MPTLTTEQLALLGGWLQGDLSTRANAMWDLLTNEQKISIFNLVKTDLTAGFDSNITSITQNKTAVEALVNASIAALE